MRIQTSPGLGNPLRRWWGRVAVALLAFLVLLGVEWATVKQMRDSALLGPFVFAYYGGGDFGLIVAAVLLPFMLAFPLKPRPLTLVISAVACYAWVYAAVVAGGIGC